MCENEANRGQIQEIREIKEKIDKMDQDFDKKISANRDDNREVTDYFSKNIIDLVVIFFVLGMVLSIGIFYPEFSLFE